MSHKSEGWTTHPIHMASHYKQSTTGQKLPVKFISSKEQIAELVISVKRECN
jgi:hypothetical protein